MRTLVITTIVGALSSAPAAAQEAVGSASPPLHSVVFTAREGGECEDRHGAQNARCMDVVDVMDMDRAWPDPDRRRLPPTSYERAVLREVARQRGLSPKLPSLNAARYVARLFSRISRLCATKSRLGRPPSRL